MEADIVVRPRPVGPLYYARLWALDAATLGRRMLNGSGRNGSTSDVRILLYHDIVNLRPAEDPLRSSLPAALFDRHIGWLREQGYSFMSVEQAAAAIATGTAPPRAVVVTFDDGHASILTDALPVLKRYGVPATLFVAVGSIGQDGFAWMPPGNRFTRPLTWDELKRVAGEIPLEIGSHTMSHRPLHTLPPREQQTEARESRLRLEERLGRPVRVFAYPFGGWNTFPPDVQQTLRDAGYVAACANVMGANGRDVSPMALRRIRIGWHDTPWRFRLKVNGAYDWTDDLRQRMHTA